MTDIFVQDSTGISVNFQVVHCAFENNRAVVAGGAFFSTGGSSKGSFNFHSDCVFQNNTAAKYGNTFATGPVEMRLALPGNESVVLVSDGSPLVFTAALVDSYGQVVVGASYIVDLAIEEELVFHGNPSDVSRNAGAGNMTFSVLLGLGQNGSRYHPYTLTAAMEDGSIQGEFQVVLVNCRAGQIQSAVERTCEDVRVNELSETRKSVRFC